MERMDERAAALAVERHECPQCGAGMGSACQTPYGDTAHRYHTQRFVLVPELRAAVEVLVPGDREPGRPWKPAAPAARESPTPFRIGYAWSAPLAGSDDDLSVQVRLLESARCDRIFNEEIGSAVKRRPTLERALDLARETRRVDADRDVIVAVAELKRLARTSAELSALAAALRAERIRLEVLAGPLSGVHDPCGGGSMLFEVLAAAAELDRAHVRSKTVEGQRAAAAGGRRSGRPKVFDDELLAQARALRDQGVSVPDIAAQLTLASGKNAGRHPSLASVYRALAEPEATAESSTTDEPSLVR